MGLDMYLSKAPKINGYSFEKILQIEERCYNFKNFQNSELYEEVKPFIKKKDENIEWYGLLEEVGYWRKANAIHKWCEENLKFITDGYYEVTKKDLEKLKRVCEFVIEKSKMVDGMISVGQRLTDNGWEDILEEGKIISNPEIAREYLPTTRGCFFGSTDYDEFYIYKLSNTIQIIDDVLKKTDFEKEFLVYWASW